MTKSGYASMERSKFIWEIFSNVTVAIFFGLFAYAFGRSFLNTFKVSAFLLFIEETLDSVFYLCRKMPRAVSLSFLCWVAGFGGTVTPLLMRPTVGAGDIWVGDFLQYVGLLGGILAIISLNRSFGIVPANRGIKRSGMYKLVRHPLYLTYTVILLGFIINNFSMKNLIILVIATSFQIFRIFNEEKFLSADVGYLEYCKETKWRMIPFVF